MLKINWKSWAKVCVLLLFIARQASVCLVAGALLVCHEKITHFWTLIYHLQTVRNKKCLMSLRIVFKYTVCRKLPPFTLIHDFGKQNTSGNVSKISINLICYRHVRSKSTNHSPLSWRKEEQKITLVAVIGGFRSDLSITCKDI